jgi:Zn-dependent peptidase ImmA (M78 family)
MNVCRPTISEAILKLYDEANIELPSGETAITPLRDLVGSLNLNCVELCDLTSRAAVDFLMLRGVPVLASENINEEQLAGYLHASMNFGCIFVNQTDRVTRRRFSIAHEIGHYVLHFQPLIDEFKRRGQSISISVTDTPTADEANGGEDREGMADTNFALAISFSDDEIPTELLPRLEEMEREADLFACELLMPREVVRQLASRLELPKDDLAWRLATDMLVSRSTMYRRLEELQLF